jgi:hypothetical protein
MGQGRPKTGLSASALSNGSEPPARGGALASGPQRPPVRSIASPRSRLRSRRH